MLRRAWKAPTRKTRNTEHRNILIHTVSGSCICGGTHSVCDFLQPTASTDFRLVSQFALSINNCRGLGAFSGLPMRERAFGAKQTPGGEGCFPTICQLVHFTTIPGWWCETSVPAFARVPCSVKHYEVEVTR